MPKIFLRPNSPEYAEGKDDIPRTHYRCCDMPDCRNVGEYRAPKDRSLGEYYWFCLEHVQEYNKAWNYFSGMSQADVEDYINTATVWDRPTRRFDSMAEAAEKLKAKAHQTYHFTEDEPVRERAAGYNISRQTPEFEAMALMGLEPPVTLEDIKSRYKILAKKYHPDHNGQNPDNEEMLKKINMAYTILKMAYQKFETLPER